MSRSRKPEPSSHQTTIDECITETEHIKGGVPAGTAEANAARDQFYVQFVAEVEKLQPLVCLPDYGVHVYRIGLRRCVCKELTRSLQKCEAEFKELP